MRYFLWLVKFALFVLVLSFAVKNTETVSVRYYLGLEWQAPLVLVLLTFFCLGVVIGIIASLGQVFRQRRQISALKSELRVQSQSGKASPDSVSDIP
jgi:putative membrane protein